MDMYRRITGHARSLAILLLALPITTGLFFMLVAGAPSNFIITNAAVFVVSAMMILIVKFPVSITVQTMLSAICLSLLAATLVLGIPADGIRRWLSLGPLRLHTAMLLLPMICVWATRVKGPSATAAFAICAAIFALQPDRASALALFLSAISITLLQRSLWSLTMLIFAAIGLAVTMLRDDQLVGVPFVEFVVRDGFAYHPTLGFILVCTTAIAIGLPLLMGRNGAPLCALWTGFFAASLLGPYPTPLSGYGASSIIGFALGLGLLLRSNGPQNVVRPAGH